MVKEGRMVKERRKERKKEGRNLEGRRPSLGSALFEFGLQVFLALKGEMVVSGNDDVRQWHRPKK